MARQFSYLCSSVLLAAMLCSLARGNDVDSRQRDLEWLKSRLTPVERFDKWLEKTGELPPDFNSLPSVPWLQDPLVQVFDRKEQRVTAEQWPARRAQISDLVEDWLLGHAPQAPGNVEAEILDKTQTDGREVWKVVLSFGPEHAAKLNCMLYLPNDTTKKNPFFMGESPRYMEWAEDAMKEGFGYCVYNAKDEAYEGVDDSNAFKDMFGDYDWAAFRRRGWSASRAIDWLVTLPFVDEKKIFIGGHSRGAKQAMAAAAFDERIAGIIASSPGSGGSMPYRYSDGTMFAESAEILTERFPHWVLLKARLYSGRENKFPTDSHFIYSMIAPRPVLISAATNDWVENTWILEQVFQNLEPVYGLLGAERNLGYRYRPGQHATDDETHKAYSKWLLMAANGGNLAAAFPFTPIHVWDYEKWAKTHPNHVLPAGNTGPFARDNAVQRINWLLGDGPAYEKMSVTLQKGETEMEAKMLARNSPPPPMRTKCVFADGIYGNVYYPSLEAAKDKEHKKPAVIWLCPFHTSTGYTGGFYRSSEITYVQLAKAGFVVMAFDQIGTGGRQDERRGFYEKYPDWSLMGKMVMDARHAIDALASVPNVDPNRIYLFGYAMGGMVAALTAAVDDRVAGTVSIAGFTPFRTDTDAKGMGGIRRYSHYYGWMPRMGAFVGRESNVPIDFDEILACIAPRSMLVVAPRVDWHADLGDIRQAVETARKTYSTGGAADKLVIDAPDDWNRLTDAMQDSAIAWLKNVDSQ